MTGTEVVDTAQGQATVVSYTAQGSGTTGYGTVMAAPAPDSRYAQISALTESQEDSAALTDAIIESLA
ncbi:MAG: hypothetical protein Q4C85_09740 [Actinomyces sp.]|uniref:hypothetical protein n=1 Tax=Actinomyces sp. TaxID=29317 RepID=UPI0026DB831E|nr:hypothetical protein [Actinomyces sp.]MDO4244018.1 hypothetical protein [Actinomyces sp.]